MQFTIVFQRAYSRIIAEETDEGFITDVRLSQILNNIFVIYPYISIQREFGYSDVTQNNNIARYVETLFRETEQHIRILHKVKQKYQQLLANTSTYDDTELLEYMLPVYVINLKERDDRRNHIIQEFDNKSEYDFHIIDAVIDQRGNVGLWKSICSIIKKAKSNKEDVILICEDDHIFTNDYNRLNLFRAIISAGEIGAEILLGGVGGFGDAVHVTSNLFWTNWFWCTQFLIVYRSAFDTILEANFTKSDVADEFLSRILTNKLLYLPFLSEQRDFGYSDVTSSNNHTGRITSHFKHAHKRASYYLNCINFYNRIGKDSFASPTKTKPSISKLHIGCGNHLLDGWINTDIRPISGVTYMDASAPFPYDDCSFDFIFSEHLFEHINFSEGKLMLKECYRTLKKGGVLRLTLPDITFLYNIWNSPDIPLHSKYIHWSIGRYAPHVMKDLDKCGNKVLASYLMNMFMHEWEHKHIYDFETLRILLANTGFVDIRRLNIGESKHTDLKNIEGHGNEIPSWANKFESMTIEASVPIE